MLYTQDRQINPPSFFEEEIENEYVDCDLCGEAFLIENMEGLILLDNGEPVAYNCVCEECVKLNTENK